MSTKLPGLNTDINAWIAFNNYFKAQKEFIDFEVHAVAEPPRLKQYSRFFFHETASDTISSAQATGNNEYSAGATIDYLVSEALFEDGGNLDLTFGGSSRGETQPAYIAGDWYYYCKGSYDQNSSTLGQGKYIVSQTVPTYSAEKGGWYDATLGRAIMMFSVNVGVTYQIISLGNDVLKGMGSPIDLGFSPGKAGQIWIDIANEAVFFSFGTGATDWITASDTGLLTNTYRTGIIYRSDWTGEYFGSVEINYTVKVGTFTIGEAFTSGSHNGIVTQDTGTKLILGNVFYAGPAGNSGKFVVGNIITGTDSGATATCTSNTENVDTLITHNLNTAKERLYVNLQITYNSTVFNVPLSIQSTGNSGFTLYEESSSALKLVVGSVGWKYMLETFVLSANITTQEAAFEITVVKLF